MNRRGEKPLDLQPDSQQKKPEGPVDLLAGDSITRFDKAKKKKKKRKSSDRQDRQSRHNAPRNEQKQA